MIYIKALVILILTVNCSGNPNDGSKESSNLRSSFYVTSMAALRPKVRNEIGKYKLAQSENDKRSMEEIHRRIALYIGVTAETRRKFYAYGSAHPESLSKAELPIWEYLAARSRSGKRDLSPSEMLSVPVESLQADVEQEHSELSGVVTDSSHKSTLKFDGNKESEKKGPKVDAAVYQALAETRVAPAETRVAPADIKAAPEGKRGQPEASPHSSLAFLLIVCLMLGVSALFLMRKRGLLFRSS